MKNQAKQDIDKRIDKKLKTLSSFDWVEKDGALLELKSTKMTLTEFRLFSAYLSKINARDTSTREVCFSLKSFENIVGTKLNITRLKENVQYYLSTVIKVPNKCDDGEIAFNLYDNFKIGQDELGEWCVWMSCGETAAEYIFDIKGTYSKYRLGIVSQVSTTYSLRMAEMLYKFAYQYRFEKIFELTVDELRSYLGVPEKPRKMFPAWSELQRRVINPSINELQGLDYDFEMDTRRRGRGGKVTGVIFKVKSLPQPNENLADEIDNGSDVLTAFERCLFNMSFKRPEIRFLASRFEYFTKDNPYEGSIDYLISYVKAKYESYESQNEVQNRVGLFGKFLETAIKESSDDMQNNKQETHKPSYDLEAYEQFDIFAHEPLNTLDEG